MEPVTFAERSLTARLLRVGLAAKPGGRGAPGQPREIARGAVADLVEIVRNDDGEELWRYTIILDNGEHVRSAELRALVRAST